MIIIPARLNSTRLEKKVLIDIFGLPMFIRSAINAKDVDDVVVACDSDEILEISKKHGFYTVLTSPDIKTGSQRCLEAANIMGLKDDEVIINLQADEPFLEKRVISRLRELMGRTSFMASLARQIDSDEVTNPNVVKVLLDHKKDAIYFSRSAIPFSRGADVNFKYLGHIGIYGFFKGSLSELYAKQQTELEEAEKLEQLRAIYYNKQIAMDVVDTESISIDTKEDLENALSRFSDRCR